MERIVFIPDMQVPEHDPKAISLFCKIVKDLKPNRAIYLGDTVNFDALSKYDKIEADVPLAEELSKLDKVFRTIRAALPKKCRVQLIQGNHEERFPKKLWKVLPEMADMERFSLGRILRLEAHNIEGPFTRIELCDGRFLVVHGHPYCGVVPGSVARKWMDTEARSGICGHIHRLCIVGKKIWDEQLVWAEGGSLCLNPQRYMNNQGNWQLGFCWGYFSKKDFQLFEVRFHTNYSWISPGGKEYRV